MDNYKGRVLIVEDDKLLALVEGKLISKLGYEVVGKAATGEEAIKLAIELDPDVIVMDISLKGDMDGVETVEEIRKQSSVPVIYLSGNTDDFNFDRAKRTDFVSYLIKPVTRIELEEPLEEAILLSTGRISASSSGFNNVMKKKALAGYSLN